MAYAIGMAHPVSVLVDTFGTAQVEEAAIVEAVREVFDLRPAAIVRDLDLKRPIYRSTAAYGHFGRPEFAWEKTDRAAKIGDDLLRPSPKGVRVNGANGHGNGKPLKKPGKRGGMGVEL